MAKVIENVRELQGSKQTFVKIENVLSFLQVCAAIGLVTMGGAFDKEITGQWFYL